MTEMNNLSDWDRRIIEEFRANGGNVGGQFAGVPLLLLTSSLCYEYKYRETINGKFHKQQR